VRKLGSAPPDEELHRLRIGVKRLRYAAELAGGSGDGRAARMIAAVTSLQDLLGARQDAAVAEELIRAVAYRIGSPQIAFVADRLAERQRERRDERQERLPAAWKRCASPPPTSRRGPFQPCPAAWHMPGRGTGPKRSGADQLRLEAAQMLMPLSTA
jgi:hypothetical protein